MFLSACVLAVLPAAGPEPRTVALAPSPDGAQLLVAVRSGGAGEHGFVCVWDLAKTELKSVVPSMPGGVRAIQPTSDGKQFVLVVGTTWSVYRIEVRDTATGKVLHKFDGSEGAASTAAASPDGKWVAYRATAEQAQVSVWNTGTGKRAEELEKTAAGATGALAFSPDSKRLVMCSRTKYAEYDVATGKKTAEWERADAPKYSFGEQHTLLAALPEGKGAVMISATGKRRQSYIIQLRTEKKDWYLGEIRDFALPPSVSPDGRWLSVAGGWPKDGGGTFVLKLDAAGTPELEDKPNKPQQPFGNGPGDKAPAWRKWVLGEPPGPMALSPDGKRLFAGQPGGRVAVLATEKMELTATLFAAEPKKDVPPQWHILTATGEFVASAGEAEALAKSGKVKDAAKVKDALGAK
jgi:WD40 repeat protein